ncbi:MAG: DMT family transporter [Paludibacteraceae bacterium]|jgi:transporter family protein|nr:DMT family transporter [Paludibacteraceae bacterium]MEE0996668.1 DMT family transporter [Paludibacteraceae bacterium]MEE1541768.1 DMT family transporter [Paludibacteraceae bacterium]
MWVVLAICSALLLGIYDVFKKRSLRDNAVIPVLFLSIVISTFMFVPIVVLSVVSEDFKDSGLYVPKADLEAHLYIFVKAVIVLGSWICAYFGMKNIPITIFSPIRATQPIWTLIGAVVFFAEVLSGWQVAGVALTIVSFYFFSIAGLKEGVSWKSNRWVWLVILATLLGAVSGLYDKHLMRLFDRMTVQVYSSVYQTILMAAVLFFLWYPNRSKTTPFQWRWSIVGISVFLILADFVYFKALSMDDALISVVSTIRRSGAVVPFAYGALFLHEKNLKVKTVLLCGVLTGVFLLYVGS